MLINRFKNTALYVLMKKSFNTRKIVLFVRLHYYKLFKADRTFTFNKKRYHYFYHSYNTAWRTERTVEIPIVWDIVSQSKGKRILEVGNVLSHYYSIRHDVVDKYERAACVRNVDVVDFCASQPYDLIVAISTLEHVGWDEERKDPGKILAAIDNLVSCLAPGGTLIATIPLGQNPHLDRMLEENKIPFSTRYCLKRVNAVNDWIETDWASIRDSRNNYPFRAANGLVIGLINA